MALRLCSARYPQRSSNHHHHHHQARARRPGLAAHKADVKEPGTTPPGMAGASLPSPLFNLPQPAGLTSNSRGQGPRMRRASTILPPMAGPTQAPQHPSPTAFQRFFASDWPRQIWFRSVQAGCVVAVIIKAEVWLHPRGPSLWLVPAVLLAIPVGWLLALPLGSIFIAPILAWRIRCNGGPFRRGDTARIISGPQRGLLTTVQIDLGDPSAWTPDDVDYQLNLLRVSRQHGTDLPRRAERGSEYL